jgi:hypothetical protein
LRISYLCRKSLKSLFNARATLFLLKIVKMGVKNIQNIALI